MRKISKEKGFTLIELMIVVAIIAILSALALPRYKLFQKKSMLSEVHLLANAMLNAERTYFTEKDKWADVPDHNPPDGNFPIAGKKKPFDPNLGAWAEFQEFSILGNGMVHFAYHIHADKTPWTDNHVHVHGDLDGDTNESDYKFYFDGRIDIQKPYE